MTVQATTSIPTRTVIVTGAAAGIGRATARAFARSGGTVFAVDRDASTLDEFADEVGGSIVPVAADLCAPGLPARLAGMVADTGGRLDVVAHVAGVYRTGSAALAEMFALHVLAPSVLTAALLPALSRAGGAVVLVSSTFGHRASRTAPGYAATKAATESLARTWALELAGRGIRVNAVAPGPTDTGILAAAGLDPAAVLTQRAAERERVPLRRIGRPDEVADWIVALSAPGWLTGQVVSVDGGLTHA